MLCLAFLLIAGFGSVSLELTQTLHLDRPALAITHDTNGVLLILDGSGEKVLAFNPQSQTTTTRVLPERIFLLQGIRSDPLFLYLYSENGFYRLKKITDELEGPFPKTATSNLRIDDLDLAPTGEIFLADGYGDKVLVFDALGNSRELGAGFISKPRGVRVTSGGDIVVLDSGRNRLSLLSRIGSLKGEFPLPSARMSRFALDEKDRVYLMEANTNRVWRFSQGHFELLESSILFSATDLSASLGSLFILDANNRLLVFSLPE